MVLKNYNKFVNENVSEFNFLDLFLKLTEYTVPAGTEDTLEPILRRYVPNLKRDSIGNYYTQIGDSRTLFTSHLDTYSKKRQKVNHIIEENIIKTDETTVLGGDNKNGVVILLYMISKKIPGTYFFFIGEEAVVNGVGCYGSTNALKENTEFFHQFDRAIAFDRRGKGSLVRRQSSRWCASDEFCDKLIEEFGEQGLEFTKDNAYRTDSAVFMDVIPEITNLSSSGAYEHSFIESTDIQYIEQISKASVNIHWEDLPTVRVPEKIPVIKQQKEITEEITKQSKITFNKLSKLMNAKGFSCLNHDDFAPGVTMYFDKFLEEKPVHLRIFGDKIDILEGDRKIGKFKGGDFELFKNKQKLKIRNLFKGIIGEIIKKMNEDGGLPTSELESILNGYDLTLEDFKNYINEEDSDAKEFIKFSDDNINVDIRIIHEMTRKRQQEQEELKKVN